MRGMEGATRARGGGRGRGGDTRWEIGLVGLGDGSVGSIP
jgi:hypothetical protein